MAWQNANVIMKLQKRSLNKKTSLPIFGNEVFYYHTSLSYTPLSRGAAFLISVNISEHPRVTKLPFLSSGIPYPSISLTMMVGKCMTASRKICFRGSRTSTVSTTCGMPFTLSFKDTGRNFLQDSLDHTNYPTDLWMRGIGRAQVNDM
jgi:hypothetical protein